MPASSRFRLIMLVSLQVSGGSIRRVRYLSLNGAGSPRSVTLCKALRCVGRFRLPMMEWRIRSRNCHSSSVPAALAFASPSSTVRSTLRAVRRDLQPDPGRAARASHRAQGGVAKGRRQVSPRLLVCDDGEVSPRPRIVLPGRLRSRRVDPAGALPLPARPFTPISRPGRLHRESGRKGVRAAAR